MTQANRKDKGPEPGLAERADYLIELAGPAPSVHNTQPWRFKVSEYAIELHADTCRQLLEDPAGREMMISCGAALYGLRLGAARWATGPRSICSPGPPCWPGCARGFRRP